jgi:dienelactone hydrolase
LNKNEFIEKQQLLLKKLSEWSGTIPVGGPLNIVEKERREYRTHTEIKLSYDGDPDERIPAYLLIPRGGNERCPAIFAAHQCFNACDIGKEQVVGKSIDHPDQAYGLELVREGFVVLAPDSNLVGERFNPKLREQWQTCADFGGSQGKCCCGPLGAFWPPWKGAYDTIRGIDVLTQHPKVDIERIGMIGHSRGAGTTLYTIPFEKRIKASAISGGTGMGHSHEKGWIHGLYSLDLLHVIAPRPFFEAVGTEDYLNICPESMKDLAVEERMREKYEVYEQAKEFYKLYDLNDGLELFVFNGGHSFPIEARKASYAFLKKHLMKH